MRKSKGQLLAGQIARGNIDLKRRPELFNDDGTFSTVESMSFNDGTGEILVPTIVNGRRVSFDEAVDNYYKTGEHLGIFKDSTSATAYGKSLSKKQGLRKIR